MSSTAMSLCRPAAQHVTPRLTSRPRTPPCPASRPSTSGSGSHRASNVRVSAKRFGFGTDEAVVDDDGAVLSRRTLLAGKALFTVGEAFVFPWATEGATRPTSSVTENLVPFSPEWLKSVLYNETPTEAKASAKSFLLEGEALASRGEHLQAIENFEKVYTTAPTEYKLCQRAGLDIAKSYKKLSSKPGDAYDKKAELAKGEVWWWGRGTRWPGWYIIAYLSGRNLYFTAKDDEVGAFTATEGLTFLVPIWFGLLYVLVSYGLPDY